MNEPTERAVLVHEDCRWCKKPSREGHPAGVASGLWFCSGCMQWQQTDGELAASLIRQIEEA